MMNQVLCDVFHSRSHTYFSGGNNFILLTLRRLKEVSEVTPSGMSNLRPTGCVRLRMAMSVAQHKNRKFT